MSDLTRTGNIILRTLLGRPAVAGLLVLGFTASAVRGDGRRGDDDCNGGAGADPRRSPGRPVRTIPTRFFARSDMTMRGLDRHVQRQIRVRHHRQAGRGRAGAVGAVLRRQPPQVHRPRPALGRLHHRHALRRSRHGLALQRPTAQGTAGRDRTNRSAHSQGGLRRRRSRAYAATWHTRTQQPHHEPGGVLQRGHGPRDFDSAWVAYQQRLVDFPVTGRISQFTPGCAGWTLPAQPVRLHYNTGSLVMSGHRYESPSQYEWTIQMQAAIGRTVFTVNDDVHVSVLHVPDCAAKLVTYFDTGTPGADGCQGVPIPEPGPTPSARHLSTTAPLTATPTATPWTTAGHAWRTGDRPSGSN